MPLPRWLRSLLPRKPAQFSASPPPRGEGWGGGPGPAISTPATPDPSPPGGGEVPPATDNSARIHIAASDPAFPAKREAAIALICAAITDIATPLGYSRKGTTWSRTTPRGRTAIHLQRSRYGFTATIILRFLLPDGTAPEHGLWAQNEDIQIAHFYLPDEGPLPQDGDIFYLDVTENPTSLDVPMHILKTRALPWLDGHHSADQPNIEDVLPRQPNAVAQP